MVKELPRNVCHFWYAKEMYFLSPFLMFLELHLILLYSFWVFCSISFIYLIGHIFSLHLCLSCLKFLYSSIPVVMMFSTRKLICLLIISYLLLMFYVSYHLFECVKYVFCTLYLIISFYRFPTSFIVYADATILEGEVVFV